jgi:hypothetical protein
MNRETWLADFSSAAKAQLTAGLPLGGNEEAVIRLSCGFPPRTGRKAATAAIVPPAASDDFIAEVFIAPTVADADSVAKAILPLLRLAHVGNWRSAAPSVAKPLETLPAWASDILASLGEYPHAAIELVAAPKQSTRLIKVACLNDGYIARVSRSTISNLGCPICPACNQAMMEA